MFEIVPVLQHRSQHSRHSFDLSATVTLISSYMQQVLRLLDSVIGNGRAQGRVHALSRKQCTHDYWSISEVTSYQHKNFPSSNDVHAK